MRDMLAITKALADASRIRIIMMLMRRELCVCQIVEVLGLANSTVSKHLSILHNARLVEYRKNGRWVYYRLPNPAEAGLLIGQGIGYVSAHLKGDAAILADQERLRDVLATEPEELCRIQAAR